MTNRVRVNMVNPQELLELPGISEAEVETIIRFRRDHGPIADEQQLSTILGGRPIPAALLDRLDFRPPKPRRRRPRAPEKSARCARASSRTSSASGWIGIVWAWRLVRVATNERVSEVLAGITPCIDEVVDVPQPEVVEKPADHVRSR